jgi:hypothetical protein
LEGERGFIEKKSRRFSSQSTLPGFFQRGLSLQSRRELIDNPPKAVSSKGSSTTPASAKIDKAAEPSRVAGPTSPSSAVSFMRAGSGAGYFRSPSTAIPPMASSAHLVMADGLTSSAHSSPAGSASIASATATATPSSTASGGGGISKAWAKLKAVQPGINLVTDFYERLIKLVP